MLSVLDNNNHAKADLDTSHMHDGSVEAQLACMHPSTLLDLHAKLSISGNTCFKVCNTDRMVVGTTSQAPLRASVSVKTVMMPPYDTPAPFLQGQTQAEADESGVMRIDDMILSAIPGDYALAVLLPDYPQVMGATKQIEVASLRLYNHTNICPLESVAMTSFSPVKHCILA